MSPPLPGPPPGYALWQGLSALPATDAPRYRAFEHELVHYHGELATAFFTDVMRRAGLQTPVQARTSRSWTCRASQHERRPGG